MPVPYNLEQELKTRNSLNTSYFNVALMFSLAQNNISNLLNSALGITSNAGSFQLDSAPTGIGHFSFQSPSTILTRNPVELQQTINNINLSQVDAYKKKLHNKELGAKWDKGLGQAGQALNVAGLAIGGKAGAAVSGAGNVLTSIKNARGAGAAGAFGIVGAGADMLSSFMPEKSEYSGTKGDITQSMDSAYDAVSNAAMAFGPVGMIVGGAMKGGALLGKGLNALGGGTDAMTTTDAILGSSFFNLTPVGMINGFGGKRADTITKDNELFNTMGSSYGGTENKVDSALIKSGKKYGAFSSSARKKANQEIAEAKRLQNIVSDISDEALDRFAIANAMTDTNTARYMYQLNGGYDQSAVRVGKSGMKLANLKKNILLIRAQKGTKLTKSFRDEVISKIIDQTPNFITRLRKGDYRAIKTGQKDENGNDLYGNVLVTQFDNKVIPTILELNGKLVLFSDPREAYDSAIKNHDYLEFETPELALWFGKNYKTLPEFKEYFDNWDNKKQPQSYTDPVTELSDVEEDSVPFKEGGILLLDPAKLADEPDIDEFKEGGAIISPESIANEPDFSEIELLDPASLAEIPDVEEFKEGGAINVIPDGALHARLHHMEDADDLTKKGIPVVDNEGELQAEVEVGELIIRLSVTLELEKMELQYYDENISSKVKDELALLAGKLLVLEILYNTKDRTHQLL